MLAYSFERSRKMQKEIVRVENPVYMTYDEIREKYWGK